MSRSNFLMRKMYILTAALMLILASIACVDGSSGSAPSPSQPGAAAPTFEVPTAGSASQPTQIAPVPAIPETRLLTLEFPTKMRAGVEGDIIRLKFEVDDQGDITPIAQFEGNEVVGEAIKISDLYETYNVTAEARLDMVGMQVQPADAIYEPLKRGQSATFYWNIRAQESGIYPGTVWLHLNFADKSTGEKNRIAVSAQIIEIEAANFFGSSINLARVLGVIGIVIGCVLGFVSLPRGGRQN